MSDGNDQFRAGVVKKNLSPLRRQLRIDRQVNAAEFENRQHRRDQVRAAFETDAGAFASYHAQAGDQLADLVRAMVEPAVCYRVVVKDQCDGVRSEKGLPLKEFV